VFQSHHSTNDPPAPLLLGQVRQIPLVFAACTLSPRAYRISLRQQCVGQGGLNEAALLTKLHPGATLASFWSSPVWDVCAVRCAFSIAMRSAFPPICNYSRDRPQCPGTTASSSREPSSAGQSSTEREPLAGLFKVSERCLALR
jgi:hypothetical protein